MYICCECNKKTDMLCKFCGKEMCSKCNDEHEICDKCYGEGSYCEDCGEFILITLEDTCSSCGETLCKSCQEEFGEKCLKCQAEQNYKEQDDDRDEPVPIDDPIYDRMDDRYNT